MQLQPDMQHPRQKLISEAGYPATQKYMYHDCTYAAKMQTEIVICWNHIRVWSGEGTLTGDSPSEVKTLTGAISGGDDNVRAVIRRSYKWWESCSHLHRQSAHIINYILDIRYSDYSLRGNLHM